MAKKTPRNFNPTRLPKWKFLANGSQAYTMNGTPIMVTNMEDVTIVEMRARGGAAYYAINNPIVQANSHGYIPEDGAVVLGELSNLNTLGLQGAVGVFVHVTLYTQTED